MELQPVEYAAAPTKPLPCCQERWVLSGTHPRVVDCVLITASPHLVAGLFLRATNINLRGSDILVPPLRHKLQSRRCCLNPRWSMSWDTEQTVLWIAQFAQGLPLRRDFSLQSLQDRNSEEHGPSHTDISAESCLCFAGGMDAAINTTLWRIAPERCGAAQTAAERCPNH